MWYLRISNLYIYIYINYWDLLWFQKQITWCEAKFGYILLMAASESSEFWASYKLTFWLLLFCEGPHPTLLGEKDENWLPFYILKWTISL